MHDLVAGLSQRTDAEVGTHSILWGALIAAPAVAPAIHEQALQRLEDVTGLIPVEFPTTRKRGASARERAGDLNSAFADPDIRAVVATIGGEDQITVIPHLDGSLAANDPKPFLGYSDNTNLLNWLWTNGVASYYRRIDSGSARPRSGRRPNTRTFAACGPAHR